MGRGGYLGGSTLIRPGSSWFGNGKAKSKPTKKQWEEAVPVKKGKKKSRPKPSRARRDLDSITEANERGLTRAEWIAKAERRMEAVEAEVLAARIKLQKLERKLAEARAPHLRAIGSSANYAAKKTAAMK